jgi:cytochrome bd-type quinol oxidase subunit 2
VAEGVYLLCAVTSIACALLLWRGYRLSRTRLLFWSSLCFVGLALNNVLLLVDLVMVPDVDLTVWRSSVGLVALMILLIGLVREPQ